MSSPKIVIVDESDQVVGSADIPAAHQEGLIHRIVRVFLFNSKGELFLQQRSFHANNFPGLWDQSVGGHVDEGEDYLQAAKREMAEEIGLTDAIPEEVGKYYSDTSTEYGQLRRFNMLYKAVSDKPLTLDPSEVEGGKWVNFDDLDCLIKDNPDDFTGGLIRALEFYSKRLV